jgi:3'-5' exoribonuclease
MTLEALLTHEIDELDSRVNSWLNLMGREGGTRRWTDSNNVYGQHIWRGTLPTVQTEKKGPPPEVMTPVIYVPHEAPQQGPRAAQAPAKKKRPERKPEAPGMRPPRRSGSRRGGLRRGRARARADGGARGAARAPTPSGEARPRRARRVQGAERPQEGLHRPAAARRQGTSTASEGRGGPHA